MGKHTVDVTDTSFEGDVLNSDIPVVLDFWAPWCGPCRTIAPHLEAIAEDFSGRVKIAKINVDENRDTAMKYRISGIPTLLFFKGGAVVDQITGGKSKPDLVKAVEALI